jgi:hypothetical protein
VRDTTGDGRHLAPGAPASPLHDPLVVSAVTALSRGLSLRAAAAECAISLRSMERLVADAKESVGARTTIHLVVLFVRAGAV